MEENHSFYLLEGTYEQETAIHLILSWFNDQISFHNRELLKRKVYGEDTHEVEKEIQKLELKRKVLSDYFKLNERANRYSFNINCVIEIKF